MIRASWARLTIRRLMVVVGLMALLLAFVPRWRDCQHKLREIELERIDRESDILMHRSTKESWEGMLAFCRAEPGGVTPDQIRQIRENIAGEDQLLRRAQRRFDHWSALRDKYARAALRPWIGLPPDPSEPE